MDIEEALKWTDDRVFEKTGKHLDSLQKAILEGVWQRETYKKLGMIDITVSIMSEKKLGNYGNFFRRFLRKMLEKRILGLF